MHATHKRSESLDVRLWAKSRLSPGRRPSTYSSYSGYSDTWLDKFFATPASRWFCLVPDEFLLNDLHMTGLRESIPKYDLALAILRGIEDDVSGSDAELTDSITRLFLMVHQRFVVTERGLRAMHEKFKAGVFGHCPRLGCHGQPVIAAGASDIPGQVCCCVFCPSCNEIYFTRDEIMHDIDGAAFGTTFGPLFFRRFPKLRPTEPPEKPEMRVMGFKIHHSKLRSLR